MSKILIVDDISTNRKLLKKMLLLMGEFQVFEAENGKEAVEVFNKEPVDLILMDINMPEMNGYQSAKIIKEQSTDIYIPIIFITAMLESTSLIQALSSGGDDFISKPFDAAVLESKLNAHLRIRQLNQELQVKNNQLLLVNQQLQLEQKSIMIFFDNALKNNSFNRELIKYHMSPVSLFNGDLILAEQHENGCTYILIGDAIGHGLTAAMVTLPVAILFNELVKKSLSLGEVASEINSQLTKLIPRGMFLCASIIMLNGKGDTLSIWSGGLPESYWFGERGQLKKLIKSEHLPLGILNAEQFDDSVQIINVEHGDKLYFYSDGLIEAEIDNNEMFGSERFSDCLLKYDENRFDQVLAELRLHTTGKKQNDDITLLELTCCPSLH